MNGRVNDRLQHRIGGQWSLKLVTAMFAGLLLVLTWAPGSVLTAQAKENTIKKGVFAGSIELSGMTKEEAVAAVESYVDTVKESTVTLVAAGGQEVNTTVGELGLYWNNPEIIEEALTLGTSGNIIERYKMLKDLEHENKVYPITYGFDMTAIDSVIQEKCTQYNQKAVNATLKRVNGAFQVEPGQTGYALDVENSIDAVYGYLTNDWNGEAGSVELTVIVEEPKGNAEELAQITDVLGSFTILLFYIQEGQELQCGKWCKPDQWDHCLSGRRVLHLQDSVTFFCGKRLLYGRFLSER